MRFSVLACAAAAALLTACAAGPDYKRPQLELPATFKEGGDWKPAVPADAQPKGEWWSAFADPELDALALQVEVSNQSLRAAAARYDQARAAVAQARASRYPTVTANLATTRGRSASSARGGAVATSNVVGLGASWEPDLWGRVRRGIESSSASAQASAADLENTRLSLQAELVQDYLQLRVADAQRKLLEDTVAAYDKSLTLTRNQYAAGIVSRADVAQAETQVASARAQLIDNAIGRAQLEHAIAVLIGKAPAEFSIARHDDLPGALVLPQIPALLPGELLLRRPDIAAAERSAAAANAQIGVAQAAWFPSLALAASGGWQGSSWANLLSAPNLVWSLGPALAATIFDGGARQAGVESARAGFESAAATYKQTVLAALQEVEDNLVALRVLGDEERVQAEAVRAARQTLELTLNQYKAGTVSFLNVATAQASLYNAQQGALNIRNRQLVANVTLIRALGGGWHEGALPPI